MKFDQPVILFLLAQLVTAGGTYAAIRADLREAIVSAHNAEKRADTAHERIDRLQEKR
jgi:hypothetical protein